VQFTRLFANSRKFVEWGRLKEIVLARLGNRNEAFLASHTSYEGIYIRQSEDGNNGLTAQSRLTVVLNASLCY